MQKQQRLGILFLIYINVDILIISCVSSEILHDKAAIRCNNIQTLFCLKVLISIET